MIFERMAPPVFEEMQRGGKMHGYAEKREEKTFFETKKAESTIDHKYVLMIKHIYENNVGSSG